MTVAMKNIRTILFCLLALASVSCQHAFTEADEPDNPVNVFDYLWNKVDQQYAFFDVKDVDWDAVYEEYRPKVYDDMTDDSLFRVCAAILNTLQDGHTNLIAPFDVSLPDSLSYQMATESQFDGELVLLNYLTLNGHTTGSFRHNAIRNGEVAYIRYSSFSNTISTEDMLYILDHYKDCKDMIFDMRQNGGGADSNIDMLLSIFDNHGQVIQYSQMKAGPKHDDFSEPRPVHAADSSLLGKDFYAKPVAVLIDRGSFSATSFFAIASMAYDNIKLFGDYTGGGLGMPNGGALPNGWTYRFSVSRTLTKDGEHPEYENGVPPDVRVLLDPAMTAQGIDNIIEAAADWITQ